MHIPDPERIPAPAPALLAAPVPPARPERAEDPIPALQPVPARAAADVATEVLAVVPPEAVVKITQGKIRGAKTKTLSFWLKVLGVRVVPTKKFLNSDRRHLLLPLAPFRVKADGKLAAPTDMDIDDVSDSLDDSQNTWRRLGGLGVLPSQFYQRVFHANGDMTLHEHIDLGVGLRFQKSRVDKMIAGGRSEFVALLQTILGDTKVTSFGVDQPPDDLSGGSSASRPNFTKKEQEKRTASKDAMRLDRLRQRAAARIEEQRARKKIAQDNGGYVCLQLDSHKSSLCSHPPFVTERGLANHTEKKQCTFGWEKRTTDDDVKRAFLSSARGGGGGERLAAATSATAGEVVEARNGALFQYSMSNDSAQNGSQLLCHRFASYMQLPRIPEIRGKDELFNKADGATVYASPRAFLALRVMHEVDPRWPRCVESLQSRKGDGKSGADRYHAEVSAKTKRELNKGRDQTTAEEHAAALVADGGIKGSFVCVVDVPRKAESKRFNSKTFKFKDPQRGRSKRGLAEIEEDDDHLANMSLEEWGSGAGTFAVLKRKTEKTEIGNAFVDACFDEGATGAKPKVFPSAVRTRMLKEKDSDGLPTFGPGCSGGCVWAISDIQSRYQTRFKGQKDGEALSSLENSVKYMSSCKCGCGAAKQHMLEIVGVATLGDLLKLELLEDGALKSKLTNDRVTLTVANVKAWIVALKAKRAE